MAGVPSGSSEFQMGVALKMKYFHNKNIQNIFLENKSEVSEKQLEHLANLYTYELKKRVQV